MIILTITAMLAISFSTVMLYKGKSVLGLFSRLVLTCVLIGSTLVLATLALSVQSKPSMNNSKQTSIYSDKRVTGYIIRSVNKKFSLSVLCIRDKGILATMLIGAEGSFDDFIRDDNLIGTRIILPSSVNVALPWLRLDSQTLIRTQVPGYPLKELPLMKENSALIILYADRLVKFKLPKSKASIEFVEETCLGDSI